MDERRLAEFKEGLKEVVANRGYIPDQESYNLFQKIVPWPATEVCLTNPNGQLLLRYRDDQWWKGWHIIGGFIRAHERLADACRRHLAGDGVGVSFDLIDECAFIQKWMPGEHPFGFPISIGCVCVTMEDVPETDVLLWTDEPVETEVTHHYNFQRQFFRWWKQNGAQALAKNS